MSHFRCLELLFQATPKDKEQGNLDSQFFSSLLDVVVVDIVSLSMCPSPPGYFIERGSSSRYRETWGSGDCVAGNTLFDFGGGPQGLLLTVSRGVRQMWHYNSFGQQL